MHLKQELIRSGGGNSSHSLNLCRSTTCWWQKEATERRNVFEERRHLVADGIQLTLALQGLEDKSTGCAHAGCLAGGFLVAAKSRKEDLLPPTTFLDTTSRWDFEGWESCSCLFSILEAVPSSHHAQAFLLSESRAIWQFGHPAVSSMQAGWLARWLCWPVTNSNCPHKKLQVAAPPTLLSAHLQPLTPHPQRGSIRGGISAGDEQICPNFPDLPHTDH